MMPEAITQAERTRAAVAHGGSLRLLSFLGLSAMVHGVLALALLQEAPPKAVTAPLPSVREQALVWFESRASVPSSPAAPATGGPPAVTISSAPRSLAQPVRRAPAAPPVLPERAPPKLKVKPPLAEPPPPSASMEAALGSRNALTQVEADASAPEHAGVGTEAPGGVADHAAAPRGAGTQGTEVPDSRGTERVAGAPALGAYARKLSQVVGRQRRYPASAARLGMEGRARVHVSINRDGSLAGAPRLMRSSGHEVLDAEALRMVEAAAPFAPLPEGLPRPSAEFVIPVDFSLRAPG